MDEDTSHDVDKNKKVMADWNSVAVIPKGAKKKLKASDDPEIAGNVVPFFPSEWKKANVMYDNDHLFGGSPPVRRTNEDYPHLYIN